MAKYELTYKEKLATARWILRYGVLNIEIVNWTGYAVRPNEEPAVIFSADTEEMLEAKRDAYRNYGSRCTNARAMQLMDFVEILGDTVPTIIEEMAAEGVSV